VGYQGGPAMTKFRKVKEYSNYAGRAFVRIEARSDEGQTQIRDFCIREERGGFYHDSYATIKARLVAAQENK
jgi:hypothetical protein